MQEGEWLEIEIGRTPNRPSIWLIARAGPLRSQAVRARAPFPYDLAVGLATPSQYLATDMRPTTCSEVVGLHCLEIKITSSA